MLMILALTSFITVILFFPSATFLSNESLNSPFILMADRVAIWKRVFRSLFALFETLLLDR